MVLRGANELPWFRCISKISKVRCFKGAPYGGLRRPRRQASVKYCPMGRQWTPLTKRISNWYLTWCISEISKIRCLKGAPYGGLRRPRRQPGVKYCLMGRQWTPVAQRIFCDKIEVSPKLKCYQNWNITKTEMSPKLKCHQNWNITKTEMSLELKS